MAGPKASSCLFAAVVCIGFMFGCGSDGDPAANPVMRTGQTVSYAAGDDGDLTPGTPLPDPRFADNDDGTVTDNATGLIWLKNADYLGSLADWDSAMAACAALADGEADLADGSAAGDWRLPNVRELLSLVDYGYSLPALTAGHPFVDVDSSIYWSSTTLPDEPGFAVTVYFRDGDRGTNGKSIEYRVWPVRGRASASIVRTGQTESYADRDDGDLRLGAKWPGPRFRNNGDGTVTDRLTGLMWHENANAADGAQTWADAVGFCNGLDHAGHADWRLPTIREIESLIDYSGRDPALPPNHPFLSATTAVGEFYWTSTTNSLPTTQAWRTWLLNGILVPSDKTESHFVLPVRGGPEQ